MPIAPIVGAAIVAGVAKIAGDTMSARGASSAAKTQAGTADKALAFAREQEAAKKLSYDQAMKSYQAKWEAWQGQRTALLQRYGVDIAPPVRPDAQVASGGPTGGSAASGGYTGQGTSAPPAAAIPGASATLGNMALNPTEQAQGSPAMAGAALPKWNDWAGMGLRQA
jgi:hypothetical protein